MTAADREAEWRSVRANIADFFRLPLADALEEIGELDLANSTRSWLADVADRDHDSMQFLACGGLDLIRQIEIKLKDAGRGDMAEIVAEARTLLMADLPLMF